MWRVQIKLWVYLFVLLMIGLPFLQGHQGIKSRRAAEIVLIDTTFGREQAAAIVNDANRWYSSLTRSSQAVEDLTQVRAARVDDSAQSRVLAGAVDRFAKWTNTVIETFLATIYGVLLRLRVSLSWLWVLAPFLLAIVNDGYWARRRKLDDFRSSNALAYSAGMSLAVALVGSVFVGLLLPIAVSPNYIPLWALGAGAAISVIARNVQRQAV